MLFQCSSHFGEYGQYLAAALSYLFIKQGDASGLVTFDDAIRTSIRAENRPSQVRRICEELHGTEPGKETGVGKVLNQVAERIPKRGLVILISGFANVETGMSYAFVMNHFESNLFPNKERLDLVLSLQGVLRDGFGQRQEFFYAFRKASLGQGQQGVQRSLEEFIETNKNSWHFRKST